MMLEEEEAERGGAEGAEGCGEEDVSDGRGVAGGGVLRLSFMMSKRERVEEEAKRGGAEVAEESLSGEGDGSEEATGGMAVSLEEDTGRIPVPREEELCMTW